VSAFVRKKRAHTTARARGYIMKRGASPARGGALRQRRNGSQQEDGALERRVFNFVNAKLRRVSVWRRGAELLFPARRVTANEWWIVISLAHCTPDSLHAHERDEMAATLRSEFPRGVALSRVTLNELHDRQLWGLFTEVSSVSRDLDTEPIHFLRIDVRELRAFIDSCRRAWTGAELCMLALALLAFAAFALLVLDVLVHVFHVF
jgi:hypothetical protein